MDHDRFDRLTRMVFSDFELRWSRRTALATILGAALLRSDLDTARARKNKANRKRRAKGKANAEAVSACFPSTNCTPGPGRNTSRCDFSSSTIFKNKDVRGSNLSSSSFRGADLRGPTSAALTWATPVLLAPTCSAQSWAVQ